MRARIALAACAAFIILAAVVLGANQAATAPSRSARATGAKLVHARHRIAAVRRRSAHVERLVTNQRHLVQWVTHYVRLAAPHPPPPAPPPAPEPVVPAPAPSPAWTPAPAQVVTYVAVSSDATSTTTPDWFCIREHESGDNYAENTGNGYAGAYQFAPSTWYEAASGAGYPQYAGGAANWAPPAVQNAAALWLYNREGWSPWSTRYVCGL